MPYKLVAQQSRTLALEGVAGGVIGGINDSRAIKGYDSDGNPTRGNFWIGRERAPGRSAFAFKNTPKSGTGYTSRTIINQQDGSTYKLRWAKDITEGNSVPNYEISGQRPQQVWNNLTEGKPFNPNGVNVHTLSNGTKIVYYPISKFTSQPTIVHQKATRGEYWKLRFRWWK